MKIVPDIVTGWKMKTFLEKERLTKQIQILQTT